MSFEACAALVERVDPDRFRVAMSLPMPARRAAFAVYAFNIEVARAPWVTQEPMIAEMRLQWWRDALEEIAAGKARRHEVVDELAATLAPEAVPALDALVAARRWDIYSDPFEDAGHLRQYLTQTGGGVCWAITASTGGGDRDAAFAAGFGAAVARFLLAVPDLQDKGRRPLIDPSDEGVRALAREGLEALATVPKRTARDAYLARPILRSVLRNPNSVFDRSLGVPEWRKPFYLALMR